MLFIHLFSTFVLNYFNYHQLFFFLLSVKFTNLPLICLPLASQALQLLAATAHSLYLPVHRAVALHSRISEGYYHQLLIELLSYLDLMAILNLQKQQRFVPRYQLVEMQDFLHSYLVRQFAKRSI